MQTQILNYRIIIEPEKMGRKTVFNAYCPTLGVADYGDSVEEVLKSIKDGMKLTIEHMLEKKEEILEDNIYKQLLTNVQIRVPIGIKTAPAY